jgi:prepilin peptidase CpaA
MVPLIYECIIISIAFIWLLIASIQDIKRREVANWLSFSLLGFGVAANIFYSILNQTNENLIVMIVLFVFLALISFALYYGRIFGGGDAKLLMALAPFLIYVPNFFRSAVNVGFNIPFLFVFLLNVVFVGSFYGVFSSIFLALKNKRKMGQSIKYLKKDKGIKKFYFVSTVLSLISLGVFFILRQSYLMIIFVTLLILPLLFLFIKAVEKCCMILLIDTANLTEGDWLAEKVKVHGRIISPSEGLSIQEIRFLRKYKKKVLIKQGIPFVPVFFIAYVASLFFNLLLELILLVTH